MRVYFAGPLFTPYERDFIAACAAELRAAGFDVFVPHEQEPTDDRAAEAIYAVDLEGLLAANAVVALLDGPVVDDGTACEIGLFHALDRGPVVGLLTDFRGGVNLFVRGCVEARGELCTSLEDAIEVLQRWRSS